MIQLILNAPRGRNAGYGAEWFRSNVGFAGGWSNQHVAMLAMVQNGLEVLMGVILTLLLTVAMLAMVQNGLEDRRQKNYEWNKERVAMLAMVQNGLEAWDVSEIHGGILRRNAGYGAEWFRSLPDGSIAERHNVAMLAMVQNGLEEMVASKHILSMNSRNAGYGAEWFRSRKAVRQGCAKFCRNAGYGAEWFRSHSMWAKYNNRNGRNAGYGAEWFRSCLAIHCLAIAGGSQCWLWCRMV